MLAWIGVGFAAPAVTLDWTGADGRLRATPPAGHEISPDAPVDVILAHEDATITVATDGAALLDGVTVGSVRGRQVTGTVALQLCEKATGICAPASMDVQADVPDRRKGSVGMTARAAAAPEPARFGARAEGADVAFAEAKARGDLVLLDFSAVWCPPCNQLGVEVLHAPDAAEILAGFQVAVLDVDHRSSFELKDRYAVGGYPTVIVTDPEGAEVGRLVGYDGREAFLGFLAASRIPAPADPAGLTPDEAAAELWRRVQGGAEDGLDAWVQASAASDQVNAHLARFRLAPSDAEARWLVANAPDQATRWVFFGGDWAETDSARTILREAVLAALVRAQGPEAADLMGLLADLVPEAEKPVLAAAAAATLRASWTGDDARDRAGWTFYASLLHDAGATDEAVAFLDGKADAYPDEPTFLLTAAGILNRAGRHAEALERTTRATPRAWGDNKLRVAAAHCTALVGLGRADEARAYADMTLTAEGPPPADLDVRSHTYRKTLEGFR